MHSEDCALLPGDQLIIHQIIIFCKIQYWLYFTIRSWLALDLEKAVWGSGGRRERFATDWPDFVVRGRLASCAHGPPDAYRLRTRGSAVCEEVRQ